MKIAAIVLAVIFFGLAVGYFAFGLQLFAHDAGRHVKHGTICLILGVLSLVWLRFQSASATAPSR